MFKFFRDRWQPIVKRGKVLAKNNCEELEHGNRETFAICKRICRRTKWSDRKAFAWKQINGNTERMAIILLDGYSNNE